MAATSRYRKACNSLFEAKEIAAEFARQGNIDKPGPAEAWADEEDGTPYAYVELAANDAFAALAATDGWERVG